MGSLSERFRQALDQDEARLLEMLKQMSRLELIHLHERLSINPDKSWLRRLALYGFHNLLMKQADNNDLP